MSNHLFISVLNWFCDDWILVNGNKKREVSCTVGFVPGILPVTPTARCFRSPIELPITFRNFYSLSNEYGRGEPFDSFRPE
jgi:hypothetical protein